MCAGVCPSLARVQTAIAIRISPCESHCARAGFVTHLHIAQRCLTSIRHHKIVGHWHRRGTAQILGLAIRGVPGRLHNVNAGLGKPKISIVDIHDEIWGGNIQTQVVAGFAKQTILCAVHRKHVTFQGPARIEIAIIDHDPEIVAIGCDRKVIPARISPGVIRRRCQPIFRRLDIHRIVNARIETAVGHTAGTGIQIERNVYIVDAKRSLSGLVAIQIDIVPNKIPQGRFAARSQGRFTNRGVAHAGGSAEQ